MLNNKNKLQVLEDKNQKIQIFGLEEKEAKNPDEMLDIINLANSQRTTHNTVTNETSSRSHAICNIVLKLRGSDREYGKLILVDLAGSERAQETQSNDRQRRAEGAEINKSLLSLKECIRALDVKKNAESTYVPFRTSKLTMVLRDSFVSKSEMSKIVMIACVSPCMSSSNHSINTLRYSDRLKEKQKRPNYNHNIIAPEIHSEKHDIEQINMNIFQDDNLKEMEFDKILDDKEHMLYHGEQGESNFKNDSNSGADWEYLKKTVHSKDGKILSDDFIKYHQITDQLVEDEDNIVNMHMNIIKEDAKLLTEEGDLITNIKGKEDEDSDFEMEVYSKRLENIIDRKISLYNDLKTKIDIYKKHIKEEDEIRSRLNPKYFMES